MFHPCLENRTSSFLDGAYACSFTVVSGTLARDAPTVAEGQNRIENIGCPKSGEINFVTGNIFGDFVQLAGECS
jgi:hypothetical protein